MLKRNLMPVLLAAKLSWLELLSDFEFCPNNRKKQKSGGKL